MKGALKNADWDPLLPKVGKGKKASAVPSRPSTPAAAVPRVAAPTSRAPAVTGARKTLAHRTAAAVEAVPAESTAVETAASERRRKRVLLDLSEDEDEEEVPSMIDEAVVEEEVTAKAMIEVAAVEVVVEEEATAEVSETLDAEVAAAEVPATEEATADIPDDEVLAVEPTQAALVEIPSAASAVPTSSTPRRPSGIVIRSPPRSSLPLSKAIAIDAPSPPPASSTVLTELVVAEALGAPSAAETTSSDDLEELYAIFHEEGGNSALAPLDEDSRVVAEKLREFLFFGVTN
ncbi:unnamed protein product [Prunus brigantina]